MNIHPYIFARLQGKCAVLTLNLLNFLNEIIHLPFFNMSNIIFRDIKMRT